MKKFNVSHGGNAVEPAQPNVLQIQDLISFSEGMSRSTKIKIDGKRCFIHEIPDVLGAKDHWVEIIVNGFVQEDLELYMLVDNLIEDNHLIALVKKDIENFWEYPYDKFPIVNIEKHRDYLNLRTL